MSKPWKRLRNGYYVTQQGLAHGTVERSERGFWWWLVCDEKGKTIKADRTTSLRHAQRCAWEVVSNHTLKLVGRNF